MQTVFISAIYLLLAFEAIDSYSERNELEEICKANADKFKKEYRLLNSKCYVKVGDIVWLEFESYYKETRKTIYQDFD